MNTDERAKWKVTAHLQKGRLLAAVNCLAGLAIFFFGYDQGMMGGVNGSRSYLEVMGLGYMENGEAVVTATLLQGGITSVYYLGTLVGCFIGGSVGDRFGRIKSFAIGSVWGILGALLQCTAKNPEWIICARLVNGIGTGILNAIVPVYGSEVAEYHSRGQFIAIEFTLNIFGVVVAYWLGFGLSFIDDGRSEFQWRFPIAFQVVMLILLLGGCWFFPESPRWLCRAGRREEAHYVLSRLRGEDNMVLVEGEVNEIEAVIELERSTAKKATYFHMLFGVGSKELHIARRVQLSMWIAGLNNIFYTFATLICVFTLDQIGRRWTLWWGAAGQALAMFLAGGFSRIGLDASSGKEGWGIAATAMVYLYTFVFGATWLTVPWLYPAEIFPLMVRAKGNAWGVVGWSLGNGSLTLALPYVFDALGEKTMYVFGAVNVISIPIVWAFYPESSQRTLEEIDLLFAADSPWAWTAESHYQTLKAANPELGLAKDKDTQSEYDAEKALGENGGHL
ncbi:major facilitator superfamily domain-containing protein [Aspergillus karnatakaensis]|uniref:major facilitator superfamily domain-containing protein n=1 Tax=Aspergillus karnatakaensis TaxID=1810916 RepID=UPI003CCDF319